MARAVKGLLGTIPTHYTFHVRAHRPEDVESATGVFENGRLLSLKIHNAAFVRREIVCCSPCQTSQDHVFSHLDVMSKKFCEAFGWDASWGKEGVGRWSGSRNHGGDRSARIRTKGETIS